MARWLMRKTTGDMPTPDSPWEFQMPADAHPVGVEYDALGRPVVTFLVERDQ